MVPLFSGYAHLDVSMMGVGMSPVTTLDSNKLEEESALLLSTTGGSAVDEPVAKKEPELKLSSSLDIQTSEDIESDKLVESVRDVPWAC